MTARIHCYSSVCLLVLDISSMFMGVWDVRCFVYACRADLMFEFAGTSHKFTLQSVRCVYRSHALVCATDIFSLSLSVYMSACVSLLTVY